jgi:hypothetical protein
LHRIKILLFPALLAPGISIYADGTAGAFISEMLVLKPALIQFLLFPITTLIIKFTVRKFSETEYIPKARNFIFGYLFINCIYLIIYYFSFFSKPGVEELNTDLIFFMVLCFISLGFSIVYLSSIKTILPVKILAFMIYVLIFIASCIAGIVLPELTGTIL